MGLYEDMQGHVRIKTIVNHRQLRVAKKYGKVWLSSCLFQISSMEARNQRHHLHIISWKNLRQVYVRGQLRKFLECPPEKILYHS